MRLNGLFKKEVAVQTFCLFDWPLLKLPEVHNVAFHTLRHYFGADVLGVITVDGKTKTIEDLSDLDKAFGVTDKSISIEIYAGVIDKTDPESGWSSYLCCSARPSGQRDFIFSTKLEKLSKSNVIELAGRLAGLGSLGYGFCFLANPEVDGRYFARGVSVTATTSEQREKDSRWFNERLVFKGDDPALKRRHLSGHFKGVFEYNVIGRAHLDNLKVHVGQGAQLGEIIEMPNDVNLWIPDSSRIDDIRRTLESKGLVL